MQAAIAIAKLARASIPVMHANKAPRWGSKHQHCLPAGGR